MAIWGEKVYVPALVGASGITKEQAKTCFYYAIATFLLPDKVNLMPLLVIAGPHGTGKSALLEQIGKMAKEPKEISVQTKAALRNELNNVVTSLIDEGGDIDEDLLIRRYSIETGTISYNKNYGGSVWHRKRANIFGATIIVRRMPFQDPALTSRSIIINTRYKPGEYRIRGFKKARKRFEKIAGKIKLDKETSERTLNNWQPLQAIAKYLKDEEWLEYSNAEIKKSIKGFIGTQHFELEDALLMVLREEMAVVKRGKEPVVVFDVPLRKIQDELKAEFDIHIKNVQIQSTCEALGFKVVSHSGYPKVKGNGKLLVKLLKERGI
jgi:hypothetical protein